MKADPNGRQKPTMDRLYWSMTTRTQFEFKVSDSQRNRSTDHRLSLQWPMNVSHDGPAGWLGRGL